MNVAVCPILNVPCRITLCLVALLLPPLVTAAETEEPSWPRFRGPQGNGHTLETGFPLRWDASQVVWKTSLKGEGQSSPVIWGDSIFLTSALEKGKKRLVFAVDRRNGKILWEHVAWEGNPEPSHRMNGWASSTCVTDGQRVYASFGYAGLHCYTVEGKHLWSRQLGKFISKRKRGTASSLALVDNLVIFNGDSESDPFLFGIDKLTGKTVWKTDRPAAEGYSTPIVVPVGNRKEVVLNGDPYVAGYDPATGKRLWWCKSFTGRGEPTPALYKGILYVVNGKPGDVYAVRPGGTGDVTKTHMVWHTRRKNGRDQPSPVVAKGNLFVSNLAGILTCYDATMGKQFWQARLSNERITASPIVADGRVYFLNEGGETIVLEPGDKLKVLARNPLGTPRKELFRASPAPYRRQVFLRSNTNLYCIGHNK